MDSQAVSKISSLGWFGHGNCGDEMFKDALQFLFPDRVFSFYSTIKDKYKEINGSDFLLIGGGNIIDNKFLDGLDLIKIPYSFISVGVNDKKFVPLLSGAKQIFLRDQKSFEMVSEKFPCVLMPDLAFSMKPNKENGQAILKRFPFPDKSKKTLGVFVNDCINIRQHSSLLKFIEVNKFILELSRFLDTLSYNVVFIPMSFLPPDDRRLSLDVMGCMKNGHKAHCITEPLIPQDCLDLTSVLDFAITMRLHASIFCSISGVPFIDITHHSKSKSYLDTEGLGGLSVDYYELSIKSLKDKFSEVENDLKIKEKLLLQTTANQKNLREVIKNVHLP